LVVGPIDNRGASVLVKVGLGSKLAAVELEDVCGRSIISVLVHQSQRPWQLQIIRAISLRRSVRNLTLTFWRPLQGLCDVHIVDHICFDTVASAFNLLTEQRSSKS
jgi:hypothetical protein